MATKKTIAKKAPKTKRPPKQVWITFNAQTGVVGVAELTKAEATKLVGEPVVVVGPYVLAERARNR